MVETSSAAHHPKTTAKGDVCLENPPANEDYAPNVKRRRFEDFLMNMNLIKKKLQKYM